MTTWKLENNVNDWVKSQLDALGFKKLVDYSEESAMSDYMKDALKWAAKTENKTSFWKPDFHVEKYKIPVVIEDKLGLKKLISETKDGIKTDEKSIGAFAVNGAVWYARQMIASSKYKEVIAIGVAGDDDENVQISAYYVYGYSEDAIKPLPECQTFHFLENEKSFEEFYQDIQLTEQEKHQILIDSRTSLQAYAKKLNKLMHNHNITAPQRVLYVSGMLLAMQDVFDEQGNKLKNWLTIEDLQGLQAENFRDGKKIILQIEEFLRTKNIPAEKVDLMLASFFEISKDKQRDVLVELDSEVSKWLQSKSSTNKQIFTFIFKSIFARIDSFKGHLDVMGEMYSEFLKYALGDGKEIGIVLTPPYITKMMSQILDIKQNNKVMDLATGSAGFLISAMEVMIADLERTTARESSAFNLKLEQIKKEQLLGVELNAEMYTLAATNMILRGDGSSNIQKGNTFDTPPALYKKFNADRILLNPPFSYKENGMPFIAFGLDQMQIGGLGAIIIQDSAGSWKATMTNQKILKSHSLLASIKMPTDLFQPMAGVQTSIYIFQVGTPHDFERPVKFIDFRNDGYKRTSRALQEIDNPIARYEDIVKIYKAGKNAKNLKADWNLEQVYVEDFISSSWADRNFDQHQKIDTQPTLADFKKTVADYLSREVSQILQKQNSDRLVGI